MKNNPFSFLLEQLEDKLPETLRPLPAEAKAAAQSLLDEKLARLNWVPRAEFEAQIRLLESAEARITVLEEKLKQLESSNTSQDM